MVVVAVIVGRTDAAQELPSVFVATPARYSIARSRYRYRWQLSYPADCAAVYVLINNVVRPQLSGSTKNLPSAANLTIGNYFVIVNQANEPCQHSPTCVTTDPQYAKLQATDIRAC